MTRWATVLFVLGLVNTASAAPSDEELLRALHAKVMRAHLESRIAILMEDEAPDYVVASRGSISRPTLDERRVKLRPYLRRTAFDMYRDAVDPIVTISADATLGWVIVQVEARGVETTVEGDTEPIAFTSAWIELYEKRKGKWLRVGNVSNFKD